MKILPLFILIISGLTGFGTSALAAQDAGQGHDYRTFHTDGTIDFGEIGDSYTSDLVMYLAGNQFMVMEELIKSFQARNPDIKTVYVETIPPGQIFKNQLLKQGEIDGQKTAMNPDLFASVNINHLKNLKQKGFTKLVKRDSGVYENVTARNGDSRLVHLDNPKTLPNLKKTIRD